MWIRVKARNEGRIEGVPENGWLNCDPLLSMVS